MLNLSIDLLDYGDFVAGVGDTAKLIVFSDLFSTVVGSDTFTVTSGLPTNAKLQTLFVDQLSSSIRSAALVFSTGDPGTGIDNISFTSAPKSPISVPEPSNILGLGLIGLGLSAKKMNGVLSKKTKQPTDETQETDS